MDDLTREQRRILEVLRTESDWLLSTDLEARTGLSNRLVRKRIGEMRRQHHIPICSRSNHKRGQAGYLLSYEREVVMPEVAHLKSRAAKIWDAARGMELGLEESEKEPMFDVRTETAVPEPMMDEHEKELVLF